MAVVERRGRRRLGRWILRGGLGMLVTLIVVFTCALLYRAWAQRESASLLIIDTPDGIDEGSFVSIGGVPQWITERLRRPDVPAPLAISDTVR